MDKPNFENGEEEPPTKKQKISPSTSIPASVTTSQPTKPLKMDDKKTFLVAIDNGFQPERETQVGVLCFVNTENPGFSGTLKHRYVSNCLSSFINSSIYGLSHCCLSLKYFNLWLS
jgi:tRNA pseudouridine13 synthase